MPTRSGHWFLEREFLAGLVLVLVAFLAFGSAFREFQAGLSLIRDGVSTEGVVIDVSYRRYLSYPAGSTRTIATAVTLEFTTLDGQLRRVRQTRSGGVLWVGHIGQKVNIRYRPSDPSVFEVRPLTRTDRGFVTLVLGLLALIGGGALMILSRMGLARGIIFLERDYH